MNISLATAPSFPLESPSNGDSDYQQSRSTGAKQPPSHLVGKLPVAKQTKPMRTRQLFSSITATIAGTIYFDVPDNTIVRQVVFAVTQSAGFTAADYVELEVSSSGTNQTGTQDAQAIIAIGSFCDSGGGSPANSGSVALNLAVPCNYAAKKGERIYLNATESGGSTWRTRALVYFD